MSGRDPIPAYEDALPFEPEEFSLAYELLARASAGITARRRSQLGASITGGDTPGDATRARGAVLSDAFEPLRECYGDGTVRYYSAVHRLTALARFIKGGHLGRRVRSDARGVRLDPAVLAAAATVRLTCAGEFPAEEFLREIERRARS